jgi:hypothetical protein
LNARERTSSFQKRARDYKRFFDIEAYLWDYADRLAKSASIKE